MEMRGPTGRTGSLSLVVALVAVLAVAAIGGSVYFALDRASTSPASDTAAPGPLAEQESPGQPVSEEALVTTFEDCVAQSGRVLGDLPRQCEIHGTVVIEQLIAGLTLPTTTVAAEVGVSVDLPAPLRSGATGAVRAEITRAAKYIPVEYGGFIVATPSCDGVNDACTANEGADLPLQKVSDLDQRVFSTDIRFSNLSDEDVVINLAQMFRFVYGREAFVPHWKYFGASYGAPPTNPYEVKKSATITIPPATSRTHSFMAALPKAVDDVLLIYGLDLRDTKLIWRFHAEDPFDIGDLKVVNYQLPYPVTWHAGGSAGATFSLSKLTLGHIRAPLNLKRENGTSYAPWEYVRTLTFTVAVQMDEEPNPAAPVTVRRVLNENGNLVPPNSAPLSFPTADRGGVPGKIYTDQDIIFVVPEGATRFLFDTQGDAAKKFEVFADDEEKLQVRLLGSSG